MTIREFIEEKAYTSIFFNFEFYLMRNGLQLMDAESDLYPCAIEARITGFDDEDDENHDYYACLHVCMDDEVCEDEDLYYELLNYANRGDWMNVAEYMETYYVLIYDGGEYLLNWRDRGISDEEMSRLANR